MDQKCKQTGLRAHCKGPVKMVFCLIVVCASKSTREKDLNFFQVPSVVTNQGEEAEKLLKERHSLWISAISRGDLTEQIIANDQVCDRHFVSGKGAKRWDRFNVDWNVPWHIVENESSIDDTLLTWNKLFSEVADSHPPVKRRRVKGTPLPWMNNKISETMKERDWIH